MTYLIIGNNRENIQKRIEDIVSTQWKRSTSLSILNSSSPDIHILKSANEKSIGIGDVKSLQKEMIFTPYSELAQIAIIYNAEKLTTQAQNSFLKTLEESGSNSIYILTTQNERNLLPTILSRSLKIYTKEVKRESNKLIPHEIFSKNLIGAFNDIEKISKDREDTEKFLSELELYFQQLLEERVQEGKQTKKICDNIQQIVKTRKRVAVNGNRRLLLENLFLVLTS